MSVEKSGFSLNKRRKIVKVEALEGREEHWKGGRSSTGREGGATLEGRWEQYWK